MLGGGEGCSAVGSERPLSAFVGRAMGPSFPRDRSRSDCHVIHRSTQDARPDMYADRQWLAAPYTADGRLI